MGLRDWEKPFRFSELEVGTSVLKKVIVVLLGIFPSIMQ